MRSGEIKIRDLVAKSGNDAVEFKRARGGVREGGDKGGRWIVRKAGH